MVKRLSNVDQNSRTLVNVPTPTDNGDAANKQYVDDEIAGVSGGSGDVVGPASSTNNSVALFDGTTGKLLKGLPNATINSTASESYLSIVSPNASTDLFMGSNNSSGSFLIADPDVNRLYVGSAGDGGLYLEAFGDTADIQLDSTGSIIFYAPLLVDTINEQTTNAGVTVESVLIKDGLVDGRDVSADGTKLDGVEALADVTDSTNVNAAGATMNTDTTLAGNGYFLDEDNMASDSATKAPSQQSVKAYADTKAAAANAMGVVVHGATAGTARPSGYSQIHWVGSVAPTNATTNDLWTDTA